MSINIYNIYLYTYIAAGPPKLSELSSVLTRSCRMVIWEPTVPATGKTARTAAKRRDVATAVTVLAFSHCQQPELDLGAHKTASSYKTSGELTEHVQPAAPAL